MSFSPATPADGDLRRKNVERLSLIGLALLFLIVNFIVLRPAVYGTADAPRYVVGGENVAAGLPPLVYKGYSYFGYIQVVAASIAIGAGLYGVVVFQLLISFLAVFALYDIGRRLGGHWAGIVAGGLLAADSWLCAQSYLIMTESLYANMIVLTVWAVFQAVERGCIYYLLCIPVLVATVLIRPNGAVLLPIALIYWAQCKIADVRWRWAVILGILIAFMLFALLPSPLRDEAEMETPLRPLRNGIILWGQSFWRLPMPEDSMPVENSWSAAFQYMLRHPVASIELMVLRLVAHFANVRPDFSISMNVSSFLWGLWIYPLAVLGTVQQRNRPLVWLCVSIIAVHAGIVAVTFTEVNGRFLFYTLPMFYPLAAAAVSRPGMSGKTLIWKVVQGAGLAIVIARVVTGPELVSQVTDKSILLFSSPAPTGANFHPTEFGSVLTLVDIEPVPSPIRAGTSTHTTLYWQSNEKTRKPYSLSIQLLDDSGSSVGGTSEIIGAHYFRHAPPFDTRLWIPGLRMANWVPINIPPNSPHKLNIYLKIAAGKNRVPVPATATQGQPIDENGMLLQTIEVTP